VVVTLVVCTKKKVLKWWPRRCGTTWRLSEKLERCREMERDRTYWMGQWVREGGWRQEEWKCTESYPWG